MESCPHEICSLVWEIGNKQRKEQIWRVMANRDKIQLRKITQIKGKENNGDIILDMMKDVTMKLVVLYPFIEEETESHRG